MTFVERLGDRLLSNPRADRVRDVAALTRRSTRSRRGLFRAEGPQNVREAVRLALGSRNGTTEQDLPCPDAVYVTLEELTRHPEIAADLEALVERGGVFVRAVTPDVLAAMTDAVTPQGMLAVCTLPAAGADPHGADGHGTDHRTTAARGTVPHVEDFPGEDSRGEDPHGTTTPARLPLLTCVLVRVQDPGNAGTVVRAADAAGAERVAFTAGSVDPFNPKAVRSSAGSLFHVPVLTGVDLKTFAVQARADGVRLLAADGRAATSVDTLSDEALLRWTGAAIPSGEATHFSEPAGDASGDVPGNVSGTPSGYALGAEEHPVRLEDPTAWLFGNEAQGLDDAERAVADLAVAVPLYGRAESLNVGTAATVCLYASAKAQRRAARPAGAAASSSGDPA